MKMISKFLVILLALSAGIHTTRAEVNITAAPSIDNDDGSGYNPPGGVATLKQLERKSTGGRIRVVPFVANLAAPDWRANAMFALNNGLTRYGSGAGEFIALTPGQLGEPWMLALSENRRLHFGFISENSTPTPFSGVSWRMWSTDPENKMNFTGSLSTNNSPSTTQWGVESNSAIIASGPDKPFPKKVWIGAGNAFNASSDPIRQFIDANRPWAMNIEYRDGGIVETSTLAFNLPVTVPTPVADFRIDPISSSGIAPLTVQFTDLSTGSIATRNWNFGDVTLNSSTQSPTHTYALAGTYTVTLVVTDTSGRAASKTAVITVSPPPSNFGIVLNATVSPTGTVTTLTPLVLLMNITGTGSGSYGGQITTSWEYSINGGPWVPWTVAGSLTTTGLTVGETKAGQTYPWTADGPNPAVSYRWQAVARTSIGTFTSNPVGPVTVIGGTPQPLLVLRIVAGQASSRGTITLTGPVGTYELRHSTNPTLPWEQWLNVTQWIKSNDGAETITIAPEGILDFFRARRVPF